MEKNKLYTIGLIIAIILLSVLINISYGNKVSRTENPYYAVYLQTGDMYFGKLPEY